MLRMRRHTARGERMCWNAGMPFRIRVSLWILAFFASLIVIGPLVVPIPPLTGLQPARALAWPTSSWLATPDLLVHAEVFAAGAALRIDDEGGDPDALRAADVAGTTVTFALLHGFGASSRSWEETLPWLSERGLAVAYDRPAFGLTDRPMPPFAAGNPYGPGAQVDTAIAVLDALGAERAVLFGHSAGGSIALATALAHPDRVAGLVLIAPAVYEGGGAPGWSRPLLFTPQLQRIGPVILRGLGGEQGTAFLRSSWADPARIPDATWEAYRRPLQVEGWDAALWELVKASRESDLTARLAAVQVPVLIVTGLQDAIVPPEQSERLVADLRGVPGGARFASLPGCGHLPHEECPEAFRAAVTSFADSVGW
jgi:pimeloyl-ACP methyl ester carboxylesterase